ncbi:MAG: VOC family protein, partial [Actinobacteria bacterium]|nr:VOC family protein [Actinomycetota bacterium]NIS33992.1 VOC family protein [Actinomycetota bacterium]NIT97191.1 VOC family protein [Actinomycetota bacterium]NIU68797.1 VOC family protein [Actinomycetota bacterium]NIV57378.1 VOC family protein [Actinomycetota bacterium]
MTPPRTEISAVVLGARDARALARFYSRLLDWPIVVDEGDWVMVRNPDGGTGLSFQAEPDHVAPEWPAGPGDQQMMLHLDIGTGDLDAAVTAA